MLMLKAVTSDGFLRFLCSFLTRLTRTAVPSTATASPSGFLHQNLLAPWSGIFGVEQKPHDNYYKVIINSMFMLFNVENRPFGTVFFDFMRLFIHFKLLCRTQYGDVRSKRILHQNLLAKF